MTPKSLFNLFARAEMITWALLISGLVLRATVETPSWLITAVGGLHGFVFLGYGITAALVGVNQRWHIGRIVAGIALAIVPFATLPFERLVDKRALLEGDWRRQVSEHPGDSGWFDRTFRWFINRPVLLVITLVLTAVTMFTILIIIGPPGGSKENASF